MAVVVDWRGQIVGSGGMATEPQGADEPRTGIKPLPGQSVHVVELPEAFFALPSAVDRHRWLARQRVVLDPTPRITEGGRTSLLDALLEMIRSLFRR
jgi:hypothetical protein